MRFFAGRLALVGGLVVIAIAVSACGAGSGQGLNASGRPGPVDSGPLVATFKSIQDNVLTPVCTVCHAGSVAPLGLRLEEGISYAQLNNVPSSEEPGILLIAPGDPSNSYLIQKIEGTAGTGAQMPLGGPPLPQATIDIIRAWIAAGADPGSNAQDLPPVVVSITPQPGQVATALPDSIQIIFSAPMDAALISEFTIEFLRAGGDGSFTDGNEVAVVLTDISLSTQNPALLTLSLQGIASADDDYRLTLSGTGATAIAGADGQLLDGDADGTAGGDFVALYSVAAIAPTLESIQDNVFTPTCAVAGCHTGPAGPDLPQGQNLSTAAASFASLVNVASLEVPSLLRVAPGDAVNSYLIQKLNGVAAVGDQMPLIGGPLPVPTIAVISEWINNGAVFDGDISPPTVSLTDPGSPLSATVTLSAVAADNVAVVNVEFRVDALLIAIDETAPYSIAWDTTTVSNGVHTLAAVAIDAAGNTTESTPLEVTVDNTPPDTTAPTVSLTAPVAVDVSGLVTVAANATDDTAVAEVRFFADGLQLGVDTTAPYAIDWDTTAFVDGPYTLLATATDLAGNTGESATLAVTVNNAPNVDETPPVVSLTTPAAGVVSGVIEIAANASDDVGVSEVRFFADVNFIGADATLPYTASWDTTATADGNMNLTAEAVDAAGNTGFSDPVLVIVDNSAPTVLSISPAADTLLSTLPATITVTFSESMDPATISVASFTLLGSGADGTFDDGNETAVVATAVVNISATTAEMDLGGVATVDDSYRIELSDTITDSNGLFLDGDANGSPGGVFQSLFTVSQAPTYTVDLQPIFQQKCSPCHTGLGLGGHNIATTYTDAFNPADNSDCDGLNVGQCTIVRIQSGDMPQGRGCSGDPAQDSGNGSCLTQEEQDVVQSWIDAGLPE